ncbi:hypothetical protein DSO57_1038130 [Entomophthora muscae]|uniref:Uncharacterized protein n=1 Tax=Entomophthora muscae TaxID=34485 RepID=A0ACC2TA22_9FUNG|nr:hypothetical protein DSO57_1038130 [Entomophthora muscae]
MIHTYDYTLQILYRHLHSSLSRLSLDKLSGQKVAINGSSLLRRLVLKPNIIASPETGFPKNRHVEGFYEVGRYLKDKDVTPLFIFEDTEMFQGYGSESLRRHFLKDHGVQGLKFETRKQVNLPAVEKIFKEYLEFIAEQRKINANLFRTAREQSLDVDELLRQEEANPTLPPRFIETLSESPHEYVQHSIPMLLSIHESAGEYCRNHLQRMGVQYERKIMELFQQLNFPKTKGTVNFDQHAVDYIVHNIQCAKVISMSSTHVLKAQTEDWGEKEREVVKLLKLLKVPLAFTSSNSADAVCAALLDSQGCNYAITDNPFIMGYKKQKENKKVLFNFMDPQRHLVATDLGCILDALTINLPMLRDFLFMCDGDLNQGFRGLEPDVILQSIKKHQDIEKVQLMFPNALSANYDCFRSRSFFDQKVTIPAELTQPYTFPSDDIALPSFLKAYDIPPNPKYTYFKAPKTVPASFEPLPINTNPNVLSKVGTREHSETKFPTFNRENRCSIRGRPSKSRGSRNN